MKEKHLKMTDYSVPRFPHSLLTATPISMPPSITNPAEWMHERIVRSINDFEKTLDEEHEVGARLVTFGASLTIHITDVGYWGPDIIKFYGFDKDEKPLELIQHISQLSVLLVATDKIQKEPRRIGFKLMEGLDQDEPTSPSTHEPDEPAGDV